MLLGFLPRMQLLNEVTNYARHFPVIFYIFIYLYIYFFFFFFFFFFCHEPFRIHPLYQWPESPSDIAPDSWTRSNIEEMKSVLNFTINIMYNFVSCSVYQEPTLSFFFPTSLLPYYLRSGFKQLEKLGCDFDWEGMMVSVVVVVVAVVVVVLVVLVVVIVVVVLVVMAVGVVGLSIHGIHAVIRFHHVILKGLPPPPAQTSQTTREMVGSFCLSPPPFSILGWTNQKLLNLNDSSTNKPKTALRLRMYVCMYVRMNECRWSHATLRITNGPNGFF